MRSGYNHRFFVVSSFALDMMYYGPTKIGGVNDMEDIPTFLYI